MPGTAAADPVPPASEVKVLVVDDYQDNAEMLAELLEGAGYETRVASTAAMALQVALEFAPHVAILDLGMPDIDGADLARLLRGLPGLASLKLVAVTGYGRAEDREKTQLAGFAFHLVKPVESAAILAAIAELRGPTPSCSRILNGARSLSR